MKKKLNLTVAVFIVCCGMPAWARAATITDYFPNCTSPPNGSGHILIVDPSGHASGAYRDVAAALQVAKIGDTISLMTGNYGALDLHGQNQNGFVTIAAAPGQMPRFTKINIGGFRPASHWRLVGLTTSSMSPPVNGKWSHDQLVAISNSDNIIIDNNHVSSAESAMVWLPELSETHQWETLRHTVSVHANHLVYPSPIIIFKMFFTELILAATKPITGGNISS